MLGRYAATLAVLAWASIALGQEVKVPPEVAAPVGRLAAVKVESDGADTKWFADDGLDVFREYDPDAKVIRLRVIGYAPGRYKLTAITCKGDKLSDPAVCVVVVGKAPPKVPPGTEPPGSEPPGTDPPTTPTGLYFLIVRPDGPAHPEFTKYMGSPGWGELLKAGHLVKDKTLSGAASLGVTIPPGTALPAVVTLRVSADGKTSSVVSVRPTPAPADIVKLPEGQ